MENYRVKNNIGKVKWVDKNSLNPSNKLYNIVITSCIRFFLQEDYL